MENENLKKPDDLLLVIDMQNVYLKDEPWGCAHTAEVTENIVFTRYVPQKNPQGTWQQYNIENHEINENHWMGEEIDALKTYCEQYTVCEKSVYSSYDIPLVRMMAEKADHIVLSGVVAECCVLFTALAGIDAGHRMIYLTDACTGQTDADEAAVIKVLSGLSPMHVELLTTEEYLCRNRQ